MFHDKMAKRTADLTWAFENDAKREPPPCERTARTRAPPKLPPPLYKASVKSLRIQAPSESALPQPTLTTR